VTVTIVFETHSISEDNEAGIATGWHQGRLSAEGKKLAVALGSRRRDDNLAAVFSSDLRRAWETTAIAMGDASVPLFFDWRLRECNYGDGNGMEAVVLHADRSSYIDTPYPNGESWRMAVSRVKAALDDVAARYEGARVLVIGHVATRWALDHYCDGRALHELATADFAWREGWEFTYP
jgi:alpha-ribazole phosphatase/probable phosphoglycerate mutase